MHNDRLVVFGRSEDVALRSDFGQCSSGVEEQITLVAYFNQFGEWPAQEFCNNLIGEMMHVHNQSPCSGVEKLASHTYENRLAAQRRKRLGMRVGKWFETRADSGREDNSYHSFTLKVCCMSCSR